MDLALNNLQGLIGHQIKPNQTSRLGKAILKHRENNYSKILKNYYDLVLLNSIQIHSIVK